MTQVAPTRPKLNSQQVAYADEHYVAAEIHRRGGYAVTFSGNMKGIDLLASDDEGNLADDHAQRAQVVKTALRTWTDIGCLPILADTGSSAQARVGAPQ